MGNVVIKKNEMSSQCCRGGFGGNELNGFKPLVCFELLKVELFMWSSALHKTSRTEFRRCRQRGGGAGPFTPLAVILKPALTDFAARRGTFPSSSS